MSPLFLLLCTLSVACAGAGGSSGASDDTTNPLSPKASLIRYWNNHISNDAPKPSFLMSRASPLNAVDIATFSKLAAQNALSDHLPSFCAAAGLLCFPDHSPSLEKHNRNFSIGHVATPSVKFKYSDFHNQGIYISIYRAEKVNQSLDSHGVGAIGPAAGQKNNRESVRRIEPGTYFRQSMLKEGTLMPMPDIRDKMPKRSFLPRAISSKLPFSSSKLAELKRTFHATDNSSMESMIVAALYTCEFAPGRGETKRCVGSIEDMIDFATSVLGRDVVVRSMKNAAGSGKEVLIGPVVGINGGKVTEPVSCHQSLYPYLLYYCHSAPKVRVYEADLLDPSSKAVINHGVAICHIDTSAWSPTHMAFRALGHGPGQTEVCHWIFENGMIWTKAG